MAARTALLSGSPQRYSARKPQTSGAPPSHGSPAESHRAVTRARTGAVRSSAVSTSEGAVTMPMRARRRLGQAAHGQRLTLGAAEHDLRPRMALLRAERAQEVELHRCFQIAAAADGGLKLPGRMHIGFRLSQLPRVAPQGKPLALPW